MTTNLKTNHRIGLSLMMFFQYMMVAIWWVPLAAYLTRMNLSGVEKSLILSSMAIGCLASPLVGMIADRHFDSRILLAFVNMTSSVLLFWAGFTTNPLWLFLLLLLAMICYMPTWSLTSSIAMSHSNNKDFSRIRLFGSIGWVVSGIFSYIFIKILHHPFDGSNYPFFIAAIIGVITSVLNLSLPATPPTDKNKKLSVMDALGLRMVKMMKEFDFAIFIILSFLFMIPFSLYFSYGSEFLLNRNFKYISITLNLGQLFEMLFLFLIPILIKKLGLRLTMALGILAMLIRYLVFYFGTAEDATGLYLIGIILHGLIFGCFMVGGQIYIDSRTPPERKAQAQGFIFFVTIGLGLLTGNFISGQLIEHFSQITGTEKIYNWALIWGITSICSLALLLAFLVLFKGEKKEKTSFIQNIETEKNKINPEFKTI